MPAGEDRTLRWLICLWLKVLVWLVNAHGATRFLDGANPQPNPQKVMSCMTSAYLDSPRGLVSRCKT